MLMSRHGCEAGSVAAEVVLYALLRHLSGRIVVSHTFRLAFLTTVLDIDQPGVDHPRQEDKRRLLAGFHSFEARKNSFLPSFLPSATTGES